MTYIHYNNDQVDLRRKLRTDATLFERLLWQKMRSKQLGHPCRRQFGIGPYIVDFCFFAKRLIIELDGVHHEENTEQREYDQIRDEYLQSAGFKILRFDNADVRDNLDAVVEKVFNVLHDV